MRPMWKSMLHKLFVTLEFIFVTICKVIKSVFPSLPKCTFCGIGSYSTIFQGVHSQYEKDMEGGRETKEKRKTMQVVVT